MQRAATPGPTNQELSIKRPIFHIYNGVLIACTLTLVAGCSHGDDRTAGTAGTDGTNGTAGVPRTTAGGNNIPNSNGIPAAVNGSITTGPGSPPFTGSASAPANGASASKPATGTDR